MADDFKRLVFQANPATSLNSQYQRANDGYPPSGPPGDSHASPQFLDPFFDDEDEGEAPDSAFAGAHPMQVKESNLHLPSQVAPLAGTSKLSLQTNDVPQGWTFDQEDPPEIPPPPRKPKKVSRRKWRWLWQKEKVLTGERVVALNNSDANADFLSNYVSTTKYNMATFLPKFLFGSLFSLGDLLPLRLTSPSAHFLLSEQFSKYANLFFLFTAFIQQIPGVSPTNRWTTIAPLSVVLLASALKEVQEDLVRFGIPILLLTHFTRSETTPI